VRAGKRRGRLLFAGAAAGLVAVFAAFADAGGAADLAMPVNASPPTISGTPEEGKTLTAARGTWNNNPTDYDYFWRRCASDGFSCATITGATNLSYTLRALTSATRCGSGWWRRTPMARPRRCRRRRVWFRRRR
jgi:hypothetical protein